MSTAVIARNLAALSCADVSVRAGRREIVARCNWEHHPGGIAWLFGNNGSGKSSLLRILAGFQRPASGRVEWTPRVDKVCFLAPSMGAPGELRIRDFMDLIGAISFGSEDEHLDLLCPQIADENTRFRTLSTGEAKRLLLWSILRQPPQPLILDEPYEHLSRDGKAALTALLQRWAEETIVVVATNQDVPIRLQDTSLTLNGARLEVARGEAHR